MVLLWGIIISVNFVILFSKLIRFFGGCFFLFVKIIILLSTEFRGIAEDEFIIGGKVMTLDLGFFFSKY